MSDIINNLLPIFLIFALGYGCRRIGFLTKDNADLFLKLFFYLVLPAVVILSISRVPLTFHLLTLPLITIILIAISYGVANFSRRFFNLPRETVGVFLIGSTILNGAFVYPFVLAIFKESGLAVAYLFDFGNALVAFSFAYYLACRYGKSGSSLSGRALYRKFLLSPPLLALILAVTINLSGVQLPQAAYQFLRTMGSLTTPLIMLSLGIYFSPRIINPGPLFTVVAIRIFGGLVMGVLLSYLFGFTGESRIITIIMALSPSAMNTLIYATLEGLDKEFAASIISYTTLISMVLISVMIFVLY